MNPLDYLDVGKSLGVSSVIEQYAEEVDTQDELVELIKEECADEVTPGEFAVELGSQDVYDEYVVDIDDLVVTLNEIHKKLCMSDSFRVYGSPKRRIRDLTPEDSDGEIRTIDARVSYVQQSFEMRVAIDFKCDKCANTHTYEQKIYTSEVDEPNFCPHCDEYFSGYQVEGSEKYVEAQRLIFEDLPAYGSDDMVVYLYDDMVNTISAGNRAEITGVVTRVQSDDNSNEAERVALALGIESRELEQNKPLFEEDAEWCRKELEAGSVDKIVQSIAPEIVQRDAEKKGLLHSLVSGHNEALEDERTDSHCLFIGDPGVGKTQIIKWVNEHIKGVEMADGGGSSGVGLTGVVKRDERLGGEWTVYPGVLSRVNKGVAVVDELDNVGEGDLESLNKALESGVVKLDKAVSAKLPAKTTLIAAANPKYGSFDLYNESIADQFDLPDPLLSRFDLIYPFKRDDVDMNGEYAEAQTSRFGASPSPSQNAPYTPEEVGMLVRFARSLDVKLSPEAERTASEVWEEVQRGTGGDDQQWLDSRRFEGLLRLSLASARLHARERATPEDVFTALGLMQDAFGSFLNDEGVLMVDFETGKSPVSQEVRKMVFNMLSGSSNETAEIALSEVEERVMDVVDCESALVRGEVEQMDDVWVGDDGKVRLSE